MTTRNYKSWQLKAAEYTLRDDRNELAVHGQIGFEGGTLCWASFDWDQPRTFKLEIARMVDAIEVISHDGEAEARLIDPQHAEVHIAKPGRYFIRTDHVNDLPLLIFADPPEEDVPTENDPGIHYFGPGKHDAGRIMLDSGQTLYLARGAVVYGSVQIKPKAHDVTIRGRGILHAAKIPFRGTKESGGAFVGVHRCRNLRIEDVTLADSFAGNLYGKEIDGGVIRNVKVLSERLYSTDGLMIINSRDVLIEDCFIRTKDDCVTLKGLCDRDKPDTWTPLRDVTVRGCLLWSTNNDVLNVGAENRASVIERITFEDCTIISASNTCGDIAGCLAVQCLDDTVIRDITFQRIVVHHLRGHLFNCYFADFFYTIPGLRRPEGGVMERITFRDIEVLDGLSRRCFLRGLDEQHVIRDVRIQNIVFNGQRVLSPEALRLETAHAEFTIT